MLTKIKTIVKKIIQELKVFQDVRAIGLVGFGVVAILVTWSGVKVAQDNYELGKKISVARQKNDIAQLENQNLKLKNTYYETNQFLELSARRQFGRALPSEKLYIVPEEVALKKTVEMPISIAKVQDSEPNRPKFLQNIDKWINFLSK